MEEDPPRIISVVGLLRTSDQGYEIFVDPQVRWQLDIIELGHRNAGHMVEVTGERIGHWGLKVRTMFLVTPDIPTEENPHW